MIQKRYTLSFLEKILGTAENLTVRLGIS